MGHKSCTISRIHIVRLNVGDEIVRGLLEASKELGVKGGIVVGIGGVDRARVAVFNPETGEYETTTLEGFHEVASLLGNISLRDGEPYAHVHVTLSNGERTMAGHLVEAYVQGTLEAAILELDRPLTRTPRDGGLALLDI